MKGVALPRILTAAITREFVRWRQQLNNSNHLASEHVSYCHMALDNLFWHWQLRLSWGNASGGRSSVDRLCLATQSCHQNLRCAYHLVFVWGQNGEGGPLFHTH